jgi:hypothetical protein
MARSREKALFGAMFALGLLAAAVAAYGVRSGPRHGDPAATRPPAQVESAPVTSPAAANMAERDPGVPPPPAPPQPTVALALPEAKTPAIPVPGPVAAIAATVSVPVARQPPPAITARRLWQPHRHRLARHRGHDIVVVRGQAASGAASARGRLAGPRIVRWAE